MKSAIAFVWLFASGGQEAGLDGTVTGEAWTWRAAPEEAEHVEVRATFTILEPSKHQEFFGRHWSVWPDATFSDGGYDAGVLLRGQKDRGYRVQVSSKRREIALVKYPDGGYVRVVPADVEAGRAHAIVASARGRTLAVSLDGKEILRYRDALDPLGKGRAGVGAVHRAKVAYERVTVKALAPDDREAAASAPHRLRLAARRWLGDRPWIFDGDEPILLLPVKDATYINNVKLRPGLKPLLSWNSHWDVQTQGAFKEADNTLEDLATEGGGESLTARWSFRHVRNRFVVRTILKVGWDERREVYVYDVESELEVLPGDPFHFRYGYDFEHHTPLDPFRWQYLIVRREGGRLAHRPVYPVDPGVMTGVAQSGGARVWYGRHGEEMRLAPAVEYDLPEAGNRKLNTAVCAAFYDTGVSFEQETAPPGTKVRVRYRYTGYPAREAEELFRASSIYESLMLDPDHHYLFADEWPRIAFGGYEPMSRTWIYGRRPFMTGHNQRPTYALLKEGGPGGRPAMRLGPGAYGKASPPAPSPIPAGRWSVAALVRSDNAHGPGGRIEIELDGKLVAAHHVGNGTFDWKRVRLGFEVPEKTQALSLAFGNAGTGDFDVAEAVFEPGDGPAPAAPPAPEPSVAGAIADYRMEEGKGAHVLDRASGPFGMLELSNVEWVRDEGRPALRFADGVRRLCPRAGTLERGYLSHPSYAERREVPVALAGFHGGAIDIHGLTIDSWIKPAARMGNGHTGDVVGVGARRFILGLRGSAAPYRLEARLNVNDVIATEPAVAADRWTHVALTAAPEAGRWRVRLLVDGRLAAEGISKTFAAPASIPPSLVLGVELFYFHDAFYRGLIGRTRVLDRALTEAEVADLAK
jgi:hypothetical protein